MKRLAIIIFLFCTIIVAAAQSARADACPVRLAYAGLVGVGKTHGTAEYQLVFGPGTGYDTGPFTVDATATMADGTRQDFIVNDLDTKVSLKPKVGTGTLSLFPFDREVAAIQIVSARDWHGLSTCSDSMPVDVDTASQVTGVPFDDGSTTAWPITGERSIAIADADFVVRVEPDYPALAKAGSIEGDSVVLIVIGPDGSVVKASTFVTSGSGLLDQASLDAARRSTFKPARLSSALGGDGITSAYLIIYTFRMN